ncbi:MAG: TatD family hydrolase [Proteobacteria bacterium]|nr:TatD family hydrolase [Pseudomonadota bacterium]
MPTRFIDTHCHLDAPEFDADRAAMRERAAAGGVMLCVLPAVAAFNFDTVRELAHAQGDAYALGIHPLCAGTATDADLATLDAALAEHRHDPRLVAMGEIGLDYFVQGLEPGRQERIFEAQLRLARKYELPVLLHVRRSVDQVLRALRVAGGGRPWHGIAHAFNGSEQQAQACIDLGLLLGFGGALTFERALRLRRLAAGVPLSAIVMETDAPDIPPHWLYTTQAERSDGQAQGRNEPGELPRIAQVVAQLRGLPLQAVAKASTHNAVAALPRLAGLLGAWEE